MANFLLKFGTFSILVAIFVVGSVMSVPKNRVDEFYARFTTPKANSLVIGSSRAAQGFVTEEWPRPITNFAFSLANSPYGEVYNRAILEKLEMSALGEVIIEVNPLTFSFDTVQNPMQEGERFTEKGKHLDRMHFFNNDPNLEYLFTSFDGPLIKLWAEPSKYNLHEDGWLEVGGDADVDLESRQGTIDKGKSNYEKVFQTKRLSQVRINAFKELLTTLRANKNVYLVRFPVSAEMLEMEQNFCPEFDSLMETTASAAGIDYLNYSMVSPVYITNDLHHLNKKFGRLFTKNLGVDVDQRTNQTLIEN
jgi:hypothetical protein